VGQRWEISHLMEMKICDWWGSVGRMKEMERWFHQRPHDEIERYDLLWDQNICRHFG
jgi:hypothetical protein